MDKALIVVDSNMLVKDPKKFNFSKMNPLETFEERFVTKIEVFELTDQITIALPELVIQEIIYHYIQEFKRTEGLFEEIAERYFLNDEPNPKCEGDLSNWIETEISIFKRRIEKIPYTLILDCPKEDIVLKLIERSLKHQAPFEGKEGKSDKGFKDVILWESLLYFLKIDTNNFSEIILISQDKRFMHVKKEFEELFPGKKIKFINNEAEFINELKKKNPTKDNKEKIILDELKKYSENQLSIDLNECFEQKEFIIEYCDMNSSVSEIAIEEIFYNDSIILEGDENFNINSYIIEVEFIGFGLMLNHKTKDLKEKPLSGKVRLLYEEDEILFSEILVLNINESERSIDE